MARKGENVTLRKDGRWEARYIKSYENGKAIYGFVYGKTREAALESKTKKVASLYGIGERDGIFFKNIVEAYLLQKKYQVKETTFAHYSYIINTHILPRLGHLTLSQINSFAIEEFISDMLNDGNITNNSGLSTKTVRDVISLLKSIVQYGCDKGMSFDKSIFSVKSPKVVNKQIEILTEKEREIVEACSVNADNMTFGVYLSLYTGLRIGELCALRWKNINTETGCICVDNTITRISNTDHNTSKTKIVISSPKTVASQRIIPLPSKVQVQLVNRNPNCTDWFFLTGNEKYIEPRNYYKKYRAFLEASGVSPHTFHALRHTFATRCIDKGFDAKVLSEILGHANVKITLDRYVHPSMERKRQCMQLL